MADLRTVTDSTGKVIVLRVMSAGDLLDLMDAAGPSAMNEGYRNLAMTVCSVRSINGDPVMMPENKRQIRDLADRIGMEGLKACFAELGTASAETEAQAKN